MFDPFIIVPGTLRNTVRDGEVVGFEFEARCGYYRRLILSMVEDLSVSVDGTTFERGDVELDVGGRRFGLDAMENEYTLAWEFGEPATISIALTGGLSEGEHELRLREQLRISYMPRAEIAEFEQLESIGSAA